MNQGVGIDNISDVCALQRDILRRLSLSPKSAKKDLRRSVSSEDLLAGLRIRVSRFVGCLLLFLSTFFFIYFLFNGCLIGRVLLLRGANILVNCLLLFQSLTVSYPYVTSRFLFSCVDRILFVNHFLFYISQPFLVLTFINIIIRQPSLVLALVYRFFFINCLLILRCQ